MDEEEGKKKSGGGVGGREVIKERDQGGDAGCGQLSRASRSTSAVKEGVVMKGAGKRCGLDHRVAASANQGATCGLIKNDFSRGVHNTELAKQYGTISFCQAS